MPSETTSLESLLYDKSYVCPVCDHKFTSKTIKLSTNRPLKSDLDLYTHYSDINPLLYQAILCPHCGYCALNKNFERILPTQAKWIQEKVTPHFKARRFGKYMTLKDAIEKHKLALVTSIVKGSKSGEQGYIAMQIAWLYRELKEEEKERIFLEKGIEALSTALEKESFPLFNWDANMTSYIIAATYYNLGNFEKSRSYLSSVILSSQGQLKQRALDLKELIKKAHSS